MHQGKPCRCHIFPVLNTLNCKQIHVDDDDDAVVGDEFIVLLQVRLFHHLPHTFQAGWGTLSLMTAMQVRFIRIGILYISSLIIFQLRLNLVFDVNSQKLPTKLQVKILFYFISYFILKWNLFEIEFILKLISFENRPQHQILFWSSLRYGIAPAEWCSGWKTFRK